MKGNTKMGALLVAALLILGVLVILPALASAVTVVITDANASRGGITTTTVTAYGVENLWAFSARVTFDSTVVNVTDITGGPGVGNFGWLRLDNNTVLLLNSYIQPYSGDVVLATLTLQAIGKAGDTSPLNLTIVKMANVSNMPIPATPVNGTFSILKHKLKTKDDVQAVLAEDEHVNVAETPQTGLKWVLFKTLDGKPIGKVEVDFENATDDIDLSEMTAAIDLVTRKSVLHKDSWPKEIKKSKELFIPSTGVGLVYICPGAKSLDKVKPENAEVWLRIGETKEDVTMSVTTYEGRDYYVVSGIKGSGGGEADFIADHVVISEVQIAEDEFVELYNPTSSDINMTGWHWCYFPSGWNESWRNKEFQGGAVIPAYGFYLIAIKSGDFPTADWNLGYSGHFLADENGSVGIFPWDPDEKSAEEAQEGRIDALAWGSVQYVKEGIEAPAPGSGKSLQRKVNATIPDDGVHGPAWDSDNNSADFFIRDSPNPQNSKFGPLPPIPELPSLILLAAGLTVVAVGIGVRCKRR